MIIDIIFLLIVLMALFKGLRKGFILALFSIIGFIVGLAAAIKLSAVTAEYLKGSLNLSAKWLAVLAFILVFLLAAFIIRLGAKAIEKTLQLAMLGWLNRVAGVMLYFAMYTIIFSVLLFYMEKIRLLSGQTISASKTYGFIKPWGPFAINSLGSVIPFFKNMFFELEKFFETVKR